ncbi:hypothetical protein JHV675_54860 [Mycobacterium avium subsp. hominissuis]
MHRRHADQVGAEVLGVSLVTNLAAGISGEPLSHTKVLAAGAASATRMGALLTLAADVDADVAIALDPDADRCGWESR